MISIKKIRIANYKSVKKIEFICDGKKSIFVGENNAGKSNILKAIDIVFNSRFQPSEHDIYNKKGADEFCYIDIMLVSKSEDKKFETAWLSIFGEEVVKNEFEEDSFSIRSLIKLNLATSKYEIERFSFLRWDDETASSGKALPRNLRKSINSFYINSERDIVTEIRMGNSNFSKLLKNSNFKLNAADREKIEDDLIMLNKQIKEKMPTIENIERDLSKIATSIENVSNISIMPIPNKLDDLDKGVEIFINNNSRGLPVSLYGDGTRSWISILTLSAYVSLLEVEADSEGLPFMPILLIEEPEAHLHPQAQNKITSQIEEMKSQVFMTSHSSNVVSELSTFDIYRITNVIGSTTMSNTPTKGTEKDEISIKNLILPYKTDMLFANIAILVEGISDKIIINDYIYIKCGKKPYEMGISVISVEGNGNMSLFRFFCEKYGIRNIIYADLDAKATVNDGIKKKMLSDKNIIFTCMKEIENELVENHFDICAKVFEDANNYPTQYIEKLIEEDRLKSEVLKYLKDYKTEYPYFLKKHVTKDVRIKSLDNVLKIVEKIIGG